MSESGDINFMLTITDNRQIDYFIHCSVCTAQLNLPMYDIKLSGHSAAMILLIAIEKVVQ